MPQNQTGRQRRLLLMREMAKSVKPLHNSVWRARGDRLRGKG
jgi:hypothetical protein